MKKVWSPHPFQLAIVEILEKKGAITDTELYEELNKTLNEVSYEKLNKTLMKLEIRGIVRVTKLMKGKRRVELIK
ncbi:MAG: transcriptional repressor [Candidatus Bathyarchaeia archaeon]